MRTEGAFLVSAVKRDGKTRWIRIESLAGEPCRVKCDLKDPRVDPRVPIESADGFLKLDLKKGQTVTLFSSDSPTDLVIESVAPQKEFLNSFGLP